MSRNWISLPRTEGTASRQAHCDLPPGTWERELGREGFFGPATHMYHRHRPTDWLRFEGALKPRAFDTTHLGVFGPTPWDAIGLLRNAHVKLRLWQMEAPMEEGAQRRRRRALFVHQGMASSSATSDTCPSRPATTSYCRAARCGASSARPRSTC
jgi:homogentisate 1,2-dioxygenase